MNHHTLLFADHSCGRIAAARYDFPTRIPTSFRNGGRIYGLVIEDPEWFYFWNEVADGHGRIVGFNLCMWPDLGADWHRLWPHGPLTNIRGWDDNDPWIIVGSDDGALTSIGDQNFGALLYSDGNEFMLLLGEWGGETYAIPWAEGIEPIFDAIPERRPSHVR
jgi:hypothetical protein